MFLYKSEPVTCGILTDMRVTLGIVFLKVVFMKATFFLESTFCTLSIEILKNCNAVNTW